MKKTIITLIIFCVAFVIGVWLFNLNKTKGNLQAQTNKNTLNYQAERSASNKSNKTKVTKEVTQVAAFSTKIYNPDEERQNNIGITCRAISTKEVQPGEEFSFCDTVGKATTAKGYQEADIYVEGRKEQGLGGGNCQVSTTLYNAVIQVPGLEVTEKHQHSGRVPYVQQGMDAAVAYGSYDFKFKNNTNSIIRIMLENTPENITATLIKIEEKKETL